MKRFSMVTVAALAGAGFLAGASAGQAATLTACPAGTYGGSDYTGCNFEITENADGTFTTAVDASQPFFGGEDNLGGFLNNTSAPVSSLSIDGGVGSGLFGFDGDGPFTNGPTGYEGPNTTLTADPSTDSGTVNFTTPIAPGGTAFFALENTVSASAPPTGGTGGGGTSVPEPATLVLLGSGLFGLVAARRRSRS